MPATWTLKGHGAAGDTFLPVSVNLGNTTTDAVNFIPVGVASSENSHEATPSDNYGNTYTAGAYYPSIGAGTGVRLHACFSPVTGSGHTVSIDNSTHLYGGVVAQAWNVSGSPSNIAFDQQNGNYAFAAGGVQPGSITPTTNDQMVFAYASDAPGPLTISSPYTLNAEQDSYAVSALAYNLQTTAAATNPTFTPSGSDFSALAVIASFKVTAGGGTTYTKSQDDALALTDALIKSALRGRVQSDACAFADALIRTVVRNKLAADSLTLADNLFAATVRNRFASDNVTVTDGNLMQSFRTRYVADNVSVTDSVQRVVYYTRLLADGITLIDAYIKAITSSGTVYTSTLSDTITINDFLLRVMKFTRATSDAASMSDGNVTQAQRNRLAADSVTVTDESLRSTLRNRLASDALTASDALIRSATLLRTVFDTVTLTDETLRVRLNVRALADALGVSDALIATYVPDMTFAVRVQPILCQRVDTPLGQRVDILLGVTDPIVFGGYH